ncbi:hypothetical protein [Scytonema sp. HK-05]|uniref:hypothetical protein n=1 Tax=Scytonema sp. HK-05 TaxID=1137095 RepID=UPI0009376012|nr:hypothetical protein [Scytonema sp. HK-05]
MQAKSDAIANAIACPKDSAGALRHRHAGRLPEGTSPQAGEKRHRINRCNQAIAVLIALSIWGSK